MSETNGSDRLERIENILERITLKQEAAESETKAIRSITESNSRAIQAMLEARATDRLEHEQRMRRMEETIQAQQAINQKLSIVQEGLARMLASIDSDRPTILRKLNTIENRLDRLDDISNKLGRLIEDKDN